MHERCDCCGAECEVLMIFFTGRQYLCSRCLEEKISSPGG